MFVLLVRNGVNNRAVSHL